MTLRWRPKSRQTRIVYTDAPGRCMPEHKGKVFAVIGPFDSHMDKPDLQLILTTVLRGYNLHEGKERKLPGALRNMPGAPI